MKKAKEPTLLDAASLKIIKETVEEWVRMDVEMNDSLIELLLNYTDQNMNEEVRKRESINWAFNDIIEKQIEREKKQKK